VINELWESICQHESQTPRFPIRAGNELSISPFLREDQRQLEQENQRVIFALGAPGTGKTEFFRWLQMERDKRDRTDGPVRLVTASQTNLPELREKLSEACGLSPRADSWQAFFDRLAQPSNGSSGSCLIVLDGIDDLAGQAEWPLLLWPDADSVPGADGLVFALARLTQLTGGRWRFVLTGAYGLTRLWLDSRTSLTQEVTLVVTKHLASRERDAWFDTAKLFATPEIKQRAWNITQGDWRILSALRGWLRRHQIEDVNEDAIYKFESNYSGQSRL
jgi:hypothetical protein